MTALRWSSGSLVAALLGAATSVARAEAPPPAVAEAPTPPPEPEAASIPLRLAVQIEAASGVLTGSFHNALAGARLDGRFSDHVSLGAYLGYANLKGKDGRAHAALTYAAVEYMAGRPGAAVRFPVRFATGYLTENGPVARVSGGVAIAVGRKVDLIGEVASMVWITNNQNLVSLDGSLELAFSF